MSSSRLVSTYVGLQANRATAATALTNHRFMDFSQAIMVRGRVKDDQLGIAGQTSRDPRDSRRDLPNGTINVTVPLNLAEIGFWLSAMMTRGAPTGSGTFVHGFVSGGQPSNFLTLIQKFASANFEQHNGCAVASARIRFSKVATVARMDLTLIPALKLPITATPPATIATATTNPDDDISEWRFSASWGGTVQPEITALDLNMDWGLERVQGLNGNDWPSLHHFGDTNITGSMTLYGDAEAMRADAALLASAGTRKALVIAGTADFDVTQGISFTMPRVEIEEFGRGFSGSGMQSSTVPLMASRGGATPLPALSVALTNKLAAYV